jgi:hypothetical protein
MCEKLNDFEKRPTNSVYVYFLFQGKYTHKPITILLRTFTLSSDAVPFSSVTICYTLFTYLPEAWTERLHKTSQEAECFGRWPGLNGVDGDSRTLQSLCFYSRTSMTSKAMFALFSDMPEFRTCTCIMSLRTCRVLYNSTVITVNNCMHISYVSYTQKYICIRCIYYMYYIYFRRERNLSVHSVSIV